ncbi:MAG: hypothetical protein HFI75_11495 [Lachnospiraceae bacterium]|nr:hypothetical protein [Lachnospiraceae bacterium]
MENQEKFVERMQDIVRLAKMNQREVTKEFLKEFLKDMELTEEQMIFVYDYLLQENIRVVGYQKESSSSQEEISLETQESEYLPLYLEELRQVGSRNQITSALYKKAAEGDAAAKSSIIEQKLTRVIEIASRFKNQGMPQSDLIQEGNIGLLLAVENLKGREDSADSFLEEEIKKSILQALDQYKEEKRENHGLMRRAENLKSEMEKLEEDLGDKMTSDDVAQFTGMDLDEIKDILRMTGEEL